MLEICVKNPQRALHVLVCWANLNSALGVWWLTTDFMLQFHFI